MAAESAELTMQRFSYLVIGGGSGGIASARRAALHGAKVALVERGAWGGTCVNVGCVPKKIMSNAANLATDLHFAGDYGFCGDSTPRFDLAALKRARDDYVKRLNAIYERNLKSAGVATFLSSASLADAHTVRLEDGTLLQADHILIATGSEPVMPDSVPGIEHCISSDGVWQLTQVPRRIGIIGGGYIAAEQAGIFKALGSERVALMVRGTRDEGLLRGFDVSMRESLARTYAADGIEVLLGFGDVKEVTSEPPEPASGSSGGGGKAVDSKPAVGGTQPGHAHPSEGGGSSSLRGAAGHFAAVAGGAGKELWVRGSEGAVVGPFDCVLVAIGRRALTAGLGLEKLGVAVDPSGGTVTVQPNQTSVSHPSIHAVGDVCGKKQLTPVAIAAGRLLADRLFGGFPSAQMDYCDVPTVVFTHPPIGAVGLTEAEARSRYGSACIQTFAATFVPLWYGVTEEKPQSVMKIVCRRMGQDEARQLHDLRRAEQGVQLQGCAASMRDREKRSTSGEGGEWRPSADASASDKTGTEPSHPRHIAEPAAGAGAPAVGTTPRGPVKMTCTPAPAAGGSAMVCVPDPGDVGAGIAPGEAGEPLPDRAVLLEAAEGRYVARSAPATAESTSKLHPQLLDGAMLRVVGMHIHAPGADEMLQGYAVALKRGITKADLDSATAIHPTASEELVTFGPWMPYSGYGGPESRDPEAGKAVPAEESKGGGKATK